MMKYYGLVRYIMFTLYGFSAKPFCLWKFKSPYKVNIEKLQSNTIRFLNYERDVKKPGEPIYTKDISELEQEAEDLKNNLSDCQIMISDNANRLLLVKDMDVAAYPHQLLIDQNKN